VKIFPGRRIIVEGVPHVIDRVLSGRAEHVMLYQDGDEKFDPPVRRILLSIRMDVVDEATKAAHAQKRWVFRNPMGVEWFVGHWDGTAVVDPSDSDRKIESSPCTDCGANTQRWDHIAREPVCWDCSDTKKRKRQDRAAYRRTP